MYSLACWSVTGLPGTSGPPFGRQRIPLVPTRSGQHPTPSPLGDDRAGGVCLQSGYALPEADAAGQLGCRHRSGWLSLNKAPPSGPASPTGRLRGGSPIVISPLRADRRIRRRRRICRARSDAPAAPGAHAPSAGRRSTPGAVRRGLVCRGLGRSPRARCASSHPRGSRPRVWPRSARGSRLCPTADADAGPGGASTRARPVPAQAGHRDGRSHRRDGPRHSGADRHGVRTLPGVVVRPARSACHCAVVAR